MTSSRLHVPQTRAAALITALMIAVFTLAAPAQAAPNVNDTARYLAGLKPAESSPLAQLTRERTWGSHARVLNGAWNRLEKRQLGKIRAWSKRHLTANSKLMLYMFSGPDFLYADAFYPNAGTYVLSALEPVGRIPDLTRLSPGSRAGGLIQLRASLQSVLNFSFFITRKMKVNLRQTAINGTLPVLYTFLARSGKTVHDVELVTLNRNGTAAARAKSRPKGSSPGVKITFSDKAGRRKTLYYFQTDLSNHGLRNSGFKKFIESLGPADSLIKSASYLPHSGNFTAARNLALDRSKTIVQDDSGVPIRFFKAGDWKLTPFGRYFGPISIFSQYYQSHARRLFAKGRRQPIDFGIGYRWRTHETNVLLAQRKSEIRASENKAK